LKKWVFQGELTTSWLSNLKSGAINENEETRDFDCKKCPPFRVTGMFMEMNNAKNNPDQWKAWANYLQSQQERKKRILITTKSVLPTAKY